MNRYVTEWERADNPTTGLSYSAMLDYYKTHAVAGDCRFALREDAEIPADLRAAYAALLTAATSAKKEQKKHRDERDRLRNALRAYRAATHVPFVAPTVDAEPLVADAAEAA